MMRFSGRDKDHFDFKLMKFRLHVSLHNIAPSVFVMAFRAMLSESSLVFLKPKQNKKYDLQTMRFGHLVSLLEKRFKPPARSLR